MPMQATALLAISCFFWYLALFTASFSTAASLELLLAGLIAVFLAPMALGRWVNEKLCGGGQKLGVVILRNFMLFVPYAASTVWCLYWLYPGWTGGLSAALFHTFWQALYWLLGTLAVYWPAANAASSSMHISVAGAPAILLLASLGAPVSTVLLCIGAWYFSLIFTLAAKAGGPVRRGVVFLHSLIPLALAAIAVLAVFSGSLDQFFAQIKHLLLVIWQWILMLLKLLDTPPGEYPLWEDNAKVLDAVMERAQEQGPVSMLPLIILSLCFAVVCIVLLVRQIIRLLSFRLPERAPAALRRRERPRLGEALLAAMRALSRLIQRLGRVARAAVRGIIRLARLAGRKLKKWWCAILPPKTPGEAVLRSYRGLLRWGHLLRIHRARFETPSEYLTRLQALALRRPIAIAEAQTLTWRFIEMQYGGMAPSWQTAAECRQLMRRIWRAHLAAPLTSELKRILRRGAKQE